MYDPFEEEKREWVLDEKERKAYLTAKIGAKEAEGSPWAIRELLRSFFSKTRQTRHIPFF